MRLAEGQSVSTTLVAVVVCGATASSTAPSATGISWSRYKAIRSVALSGVGRSLATCTATPATPSSVVHTAIGASALLRRNLLIYGLGGIVSPFIGIKLIDLIVYNLLGG